MILSIFTLLVCIAFVFVVDVTWKKFAFNSSNLYDSLITAVTCSTLVAVCYGIGIKNVLCVALIAGFGSGLIIDVFKKIF